MTYDQNKNITLTTLLGRIWPCSLFIAELAKKTPSNLREFMDRADDFINVEDTLLALVKPKKGEPKTKCKSNLGDKKVASNH